MTNENPRVAGGSRQKSLAATRRAMQNTKKTRGRTARDGNGAARWTPQQAREILAQTIINAIDAGLEIRTFNTARDTVAIEILAHALVDGRIVPKN